MSDSESEAIEGELVVDSSSKQMWGTVTFDFLKENVGNNIISLNLSTNHINHESAEFLSTIIKTSPGLKYLDLTETRLTQKSTDLIFEAIGNSSILEFYADNNIFPENECKILSESLKKNPPLQVLSLCGCDIPSEGGVAIAEALGQNSNLKHLRLESNSIYDTGALKLAEFLPKSSLFELSIADNEIWADGTNAILRCLKETQIEVLDISYNIVDLNVFCAEIDKSKVNKIALSGCKVSEYLLPSLLKKLTSVKLSTLILDGLDFQTLPISWAKVKDTIWNTRGYFDDLLLLLQQSPLLIDLRLGFLDLDQIFGIKRLLEDSPPHEITLSLIDFGHTNNCWVIHLPNLKVEAPCSTFKWNNPINPDVAHFIGEIIQNTTVINNEVEPPPQTKQTSKQKQKQRNSKEHKEQGNKIDTIDLHDMKLSDDSFKNILASLNGYDLKLLDCSDNGIGDPSLEAVKSYLKDAYIEELDFSGNASSDLGCQNFVKSLYEDDINLPVKLNLCFKSSDLNELSEHSTPTQIAELFKSNANIESLYLGGPITAADALCIVDAISKNSHIRELEFQSDHIKNYMSPDPEINPDVQSQFDVLPSVILSALTDKKSVCKLKNFIFPLFTEVFIYNEEICEKWLNVEKKLTQNLNKK